MKFRTCPHCGYKYKNKEFYSGVFTQPINKQWKCPSCKKEMQFNKTNYFILLGIKFLPVIFTDYGVNFINNYIESRGISLFIYIIIAFLWIMLTSLLSTFKKA